MYETRERLNGETRQNYTVTRLLNGIKGIFTDWKKAIILALYVSAVICLWIYRYSIIAMLEIDTMGLIPDDIVYGFIKLAASFVLAVGLSALLMLLGTPLGSKSIRDNFLRIGLKNHAGEPPLLLYKRKDKENKRLFIYEFLANGISPREWEDRRSNIETALNILVVKVAEGKNKRRILLYFIHSKNGLPHHVYWKDSYLSKKAFELVLGEGLLGKETVNLSRIPHIILGGSTGSGKSVLLKLLLMQCIKKNAIVYLADFKGGIDFPIVWHKKCKIVICEKELSDLLTDVVNQFEYRRNIFLNAGCTNIQEYNQSTDKNMQRIIIACDEVAEVLDKTGLDKDKKSIVAEIESKLSTIARLGRAFGIHLILSTQRPDANILSGQIKNNVDIRICGRADDVLSKIILDNTSASDQIPKDAQGRFLTHDNVLFQSYLFDEARVFAENAGSKTRLKTR